MKVATRTITTLILSLAFIGCANKKDEAPGTTEGSVGIGLWKANCTKFDEQSNDERSALSIDETQVHFLSDIYSTSDNTCQGKPLISIDYSGGYKLTVKSPNSDIDLTTNSLMMIIHDDTTVQGFNADAYCGITNWAVDVPQELMGRTCGTYTYQGEAIYTIVNISGAELRLGKSDPTHDGSTPERRHVVLDDKVVYRK